MRVTHFLLAACVVLPLGAQDFEVGLFVGQQSYKSIDGAVVPDSSGSGQDSVSVKPSSKTILGARVGYALFDFGRPAPAHRRLPAQGHHHGLGHRHCAHRPHPAQHQAGHRLSGRVRPGGLQRRERRLRLLHHQLFPGPDGQLQGLRGGGRRGGIPVREALHPRRGRELRPPLGPGQRGIRLPTPLVKPFIGLEVDAPLVSTSFDGATSDSMLKALAPKLQVGVDLGGIRF